MKRLAYSEKEARAVLSKHQHKVTRHRVDVLLYMMTHRQAFTFKKLVEVFEANIDNSKNKSRTSDIFRRSDFFPTRSYVSSDFNGIFYPLKKAGDYVSKGTHLGYVIDFFENHIQEIYAKETGVILLILGTPPVKKGDSIVGIGVINN